MTKFKSGYVSLIGVPNVGKSTLINNIIGEKLSIVSSKPQTTRNNIHAIYNTDNCQIVFLDTPGMHEPRHKLDELMVKSAQKTLSECDIILYIITPEEQVSRENLNIIELLKKVKKPVILVINKVDVERKEKVAKSISDFSKLYNFSQVVPISALTGEYVDQLIKILAEQLPEGPKYYPDDIITDEQERFVVSEIIREKLLFHLKQEVPHGTAVEIITMDRDEEKDEYNINATIYCEKDTHKSIIIGKNGLMIKNIRHHAKRDIEKFLGCHINLELWVKVKKDWRDNSDILRTLGYK